MVLDKIKTVITKVAGKNNGFVTEDLLRAFKAYPLSNDLAKWMELNHFEIKGNVFDHYEEQGNLTEEQELYLIGRAQNGNIDSCWKLLSHFDQCIDRNIDFAIVSHNMQGLYDKLFREDIKHDIFLYVIDHIKLYDVTKNSRFVSYLNYVIMNVIENEVFCNCYNNGYTSFRKNCISIIEKALKAHNLSLWDYPESITDEEISELTGLSVLVIQRAFKEWKANKNESYDPAADYEKYETCESRWNYEDLERNMIVSTMLSGHPIYQALADIYKKLSPLEKDICSISSSYSNRIGTSREAHTDAVEKINRKYGIQLTSKEMYEKYHKAQRYMINELYDALDVDSTRRKMLEAAILLNADENMIKELSKTKFKKRFSHEFHNHDITDFYEKLEHIYQVYASDEYKEQKTYMA